MADAQAPGMATAQDRSHRADDRAPAVVGTATALPPHRYGQAALAELAKELLPDLNLAQGTLERFFRRAGVRARHLALPAQAYRALGGLESRSRAWLEVATELGEQAIRRLLTRAALSAAGVGELITTTVTGLAVPSLDARLMNRIGFSNDLKRVPLFGLGCVGGAAGVARAADYLRAYPAETAILLSVELCSLTVQKEDASVANAVSTGLFGDGAAALLLAGAEHSLTPAGRPRVIDSRSVFFPDTERVMGWDFVDSGFKVVLSPDVPRLVREEIPSAVGAFLADHDLERGDIAAWITHPGGPKVLDAIERGLELDGDELAPAREGLAKHGNLSSASVLFLLDEVRRLRAPPPGAFSLMMAMGPAFCAELVLLEW